MFALRATVNRVERPRRQPGGAGQVGQLVEADEHREKRAQFRLLDVPETQSH